MNVESKPKPAGLWRKTGSGICPTTMHVPELPRTMAAPRLAESLRPDPDRPLLIRIGKHLRGAFDRLIARYSLVSNDPLLDVRDFAWTARLRDNWQAIRAEAEAVATAGEAPSLAAISPDHRAIAPPDRWRAFFLWGYGYAIDANLARCPVTAALVRQVPGLNSAFFSTLTPGTHIPAHRGVTKALITCHLGLSVPRDGDVRLRLGDRILRWSEGETLVFDDTVDHELWNESGGDHLVLLVQFRRPLRAPGRWIADRLLSVIRRSAFVQEAYRNLLRWHAGRRRD